MITVPHDVVARSALVGWQLEIFDGHEAVQKALAPERVQEWELLSREKARKVSVFQSPGFVLPWYEAYATAYEPLLVMGLDSEGRVGRHHAARSAIRGRPGLRGRGALLLCGWLAVESLEDEFPAVCVVALHDAGCIRTTWAWPWLAPGSSVAWLDHPSMQRRSVAARICPGLTPVVDLQAEPSAASRVQTTSMPIDEKPVTNRIISASCAGLYRPAVAGVRGRCAVGCESAATAAGPGTALQSRG